MNDQKRAPSARLYEYVLEGGWIVLVGRTVVYALHLLEKCIVGPEHVPTVEDH